MPVFLVRNLVQEGTPHWGLIAPMLVRPSVVAEANETLGRSLEPTLSASILLIASRRVLFGWLGPVFWTPRLPWWLVWQCRAA
jgi:hypothetical protein